MRVYSILTRGEGDMGEEEEEEEEEEGSV